MMCRHHPYEERNSFLQVTDITNSEQQLTSQLEIFTLQEWMNRVNEFCENVL